MSSAEPCLEPPWRAKMQHTSWHHRAELEVPLVLVRGAMARIGGLAKRSGAVSGSPAVSQLGGRREGSAIERVALCDVNQAKTQQPVGLTAGIPAPELTDKDTQRGLGPLR